MEKIDEKLQHIQIHLINRTNLNSQVQSVSVKLQQYLIKHIMIWKFSYCQSVSVKFSQFQSTYHIKVLSVVIKQQWQTRRAIQLELCSRGFEPQQELLKKMIFKLLHRRTDAISQRFFKHLFG